jgi:glycosyltransferase involved in cell wall biosynthesis
MPGRRLSIFLPSLKGGGAERVASILASGFAHRGHPVDLLLARAEGPYLDDIAPGVRIIDFEKSGVAACLPQLTRYLRRERPRALLSMLSHANVIALIANKLAGSPCPIAVGERSSFAAAKDNLRAPRNRLVRVMMRLTYRWATKVIVVSDAMVDELCEGLGVPRERIVSIPNPLVPDDIDRRAGEPLDCDIFDQGRPVILAAGRLEFEKDFDVLIRALAMIRAQRDVGLAILGEGSERPRLERLVAELGLSDSVRLPGFVDNPFSYMAAASVFALSSRFEGMPGVLIQAMACGTPVVSTDCRTGPREILGGGRWGALVPVGDPTGLARAILDVLNRRDHPDVRAGADRYGEEASVDRHLQALLAMMPEDGRSAAPSQAATGVIA